MTSAESRPMPPSDAEQLAFLDRVQRLLDSGRFTATYKFALFLVLAELAVERGDDSGASLRLSLDDIAVRFLGLYWQQATPYAANGALTVLQQNTGRQAAIINICADAKAHLDPVFEAARLRPGWTSVLQRARKTIVDQPLTKLQTIGTGADLFSDCFLYAHDNIADSI